jgi:hypothetical protein
MNNLLSRSGTGPRHGTKTITALSELPNALPELAEQARNAPGDRTGWDSAGQGDGYRLDWDDLLTSAPTRPVGRRICEHAAELGFQYLSVCVVRSR